MEPNTKEARIRNLTYLYYSRPDIQKEIFEFCRGREIVPVYFEGFGKRPDSFQYPSDIFQLAKNGATSFHCSEELWQNPLSLSTNLNENQLNDLRIGWDLLIDIDSKYIDYSKILTEQIIQVLRFHGIKNMRIKFSGSKGFHLIIPWKAFPKEVNNVQTKNMFPEYPRIITRYLIDRTKERLIEKISEMERPSKYIKDFTASKQVMPDLVLVSSRHLFRAPYSLHEKTALASIVLDSEELANFELKDANPLKVKIKNFLPEAKENEATELLMQALDWHKETHEEPLKQKKDFEPIKLDNLSEQNFPPCIQKILQGLSDGKKRALFILINLFRSIGMDKDELERRIYDWNKKNKILLKEGYIKSQLSWAYKRKPIMPPNCREFYQGISVCVPDELCNKIKNPVNYVIRKNFFGNTSRRK